MQFFETNEKIGYRYLLVTNQEYILFWDNWGEDETRIHSIDRFHKVPSKEDINEVDRILDDYNLSDEDQLNALEKIYSRYTDGSLDEGEWYEASKILRDFTKKNKYLGIYFWDMTGKSAKGKKTEFIELPFIKLLTHSQQIVRNLIQELIKEN